MCEIDMWDSCCCPFFGYCITAETIEKRDTIAIQVSVIQKPCDKLPVEYVVKWQVHTIAGRALGDIGSSVNTHSL